MPEDQPHRHDPGKARNGNLAIPLPFEQAIRAALEVKPPEKPPRKPRQKRTDRPGSPETRGVVPDHVVHPDLLGGWGCSPPSPKEDTG